MILDYNETQTIRDEIIRTIQNKFGWKIYNAVQVNFGYGNLKWCMETEDKPIFVKQYCKKRYKMGLVGVERALRFQDQMHKDGIPCQNVFSINDEYIHRTQSCESFMITGVSEGLMVQAGKVNKDQMYSLGESIGRIHLWLSQRAPQYIPLQWKLPDKEKMMLNWEQNMQSSINYGIEKYIKALEQQRVILETLDMEIFLDCEHGWTHWDMFVDNLMFKPDCISDILDFDRLHYTYPEFDISRAILSCCLDEDEMNMGAVSAFCNGYRRHISISAEKLVRSLKLTWCKEAKWVRPENETDRTMRRFVEELIWLGERWGNLDKIILELR